MLYLIAPALRLSATGRWFVVPAGTTNDPVVSQRISLPAPGFNTTPVPSISVTVIVLPVPPPAAVIVSVSPIL